MSTLIDSASFGRTFDSRQLFADVLIKKQQAFRTLTANAAGSSNYSTPVEIGGGASPSGYQVPAGKILVVIGAKVIQNGNPSAEMNCGIGIADAAVAGTPPFSSGTAPTNATFGSTGQGLIIQSSTLVEGLDRSFLLIVPATKYLYIKSSGNAASNITVTIFGYEMTLSDTSFPTSR